MPKTYTNNNNKHTMETGYNEFYILLVDYVMIYYNGGTLYDLRNQAPMSEGGIPQIYEFELSQNFMLEEGLLTCRV